MKRASLALCVFFAKKEMKFLGRFIHFTWFWEAQLIMHENHNFARRLAKDYVFTVFGWFNWFSYYENTKYYHIHVTD